MFDAAAKALGPLSAVIANAGHRCADSEACGDERRADAARIRGQCARRLPHRPEATRRMSKSFGGAGGSIVMMSSAAARLGSPNLYVDHAGSKGAIDPLTLVSPRNSAPRA
jgi:NAD(P)-dependent dehydrogenase (short-subunit alcohol dehydrogenase family)